MIPLKSLLARWNADALLRRVVRNSSFLFSSTVASAALGFLQGILVVRLIGIAHYGLLVGTVFVFVTNVNRLLSFRMAEATVKYLRQALEQGDLQGAASLVKRIAWIEAATSVIAYLVLLGLAPVAARNLAGDPSLAPLFAAYGLFLIGNLVYETASGVLQTLRRFDRISAAQFTGSLITALLILGAFLLRGHLVHILAAYLAGKLTAGLLITLFAVHALRAHLGPAWGHPSPHLLPSRSSSAAIDAPTSPANRPPWRDILAFAFQTNLNGTVNLIVRDSAPLFLAFFAGPAEVGYFKLALSLVNLITLPIEPFIWPTYAEIAETIARAQWATTRQLLWRISIIAAAWTLPAGAALIALGKWLIPFVYGAEAGPAYPATVLLLVGYGMANIFHWNRPLLLALHKPSYPLMVSAIVGAGQLALIGLIIPPFRHLGMAALLSAYLLISILLTVWRGLAELRGRALPSAR